MLVTSYDQQTDQIYEYQRLSVGAFICGSHRAHSWGSLTSAPDENTEEHFLFGGRYLGILLEDIGVIFEGMWGRFWEGSVTVFRGTVI